MLEAFYSNPRPVGIATFAMKGQTGKLSLTDDDQQRKELLERSYRGEAIELEIEAQTYAQGVGIENRKYIDFSTEALKHLAATAAGTPFCRDHSLDTDKGLGDTLSSRYHNDGLIEALIETLSVRSRAGVRAVLERRVTNFSIGVLYDFETLECRVCNDTVLKCDHYPGQQLKGNKVATWRYNDAEWLERSWVIRPAVVQTGILGWERLSAARSNTRNPKRNTDMAEYTELYRILNLDSSAGEVGITAAVNRITTELQVSQARVRDLEGVVTERDTAKAEVAKLRAELDDRRAKDLESEAEQTIADLVKDGRIRPGGSQEELLRKTFASGDEANARALVTAFAENPRIAPVGQRQSANLGNNATPQASTAPSAPPATDYGALFAALPEHIRNAAAACADQPERLFQRRPDLLQRAMGLQA